MEMEEHVLGIDSIVIETDKTHQETISEMEDSVGSASASRSESISSRVRTRDATVAAATATLDEDDNNQPSSETQEPPNKRTKEMHSKDLEGLYSHFRQLNEKHTTANGKESGCWYAICLYCEEDFETRKRSLLRNFRSPNMKDPKVKAAMSFARLKSPNKIVRNKKNCTRHLDKCPHFLAYQIKEHQRVCNEEPNDDRSANLKPSPTENEGRPSPAKSPGSSIATKKSMQTSFLTHSMRLLSGDELEVAQAHLIEFFVDCKMSFRTADHPSFHKFVDLLRPKASSKLPRRTKVKALMSKCAKKALIEVEMSILKKVGDGYAVSICVDGWENVSKEHVEGVVIYVGGEAYSIETIDAGTEHDGVAVARGWEKLINAYMDKYPVHYHCSDDAGQCARARRILRLRWPHMLWTKCFAHQINLMVGAMLKTQPFRDSGDNAIAAAKAINKSSSKWLPLLRNVVEGMYGKGIHITILTVGDTRWNSIQGCFATQLRIRNACKLFALQYRERPKFPDALLPWCNDKFCMDIEEAELLVRPFCDASYLLQRTLNTMAHVFLCFVNLALHIAEFGSGYAYDQELFGDINKRWSAEEQPLFFLSFLLHPQYKDDARRIVGEAWRKKGSWLENNNALTESRLRQAVMFYYGKFRLMPEENDWDNEKKSLAKQFTLWINGRIELDDKTFTSYSGEYPADWWMNNKRKMPQLSWFAIFLLSAPVQGADCERLFKDLALFHTKARNRMHIQTTFESTAVSHSLRQQYPDDYTPNSGGKTKNRFIEPKEYKRRDAIPDSPERARYPLRQPSQTQEMEMENEGEQNTTDAVAELDSEEAEMESNDDDIVLDLTDTTHMNVWVEILAHNASNDDADVFENELEFTETESAIDHTEDAYEIQPSPLPELPLENDPKYPQEDAAYFRRKKYVRTDKYSLNEIVSYVTGDDHYKFPSILSGYEHSKANETSSTW